MKKTILLAVLISGMTAGCSLLPAKPIEWTDASVSLVWPSPPDAPRVRFLRTLTGPADFEDKGTQGQMFKWLTGEEDQGQPLVSPYGIAADGDGKVWVADSGTQSIHVFDLRRRRVDYISVAGENLLISPVGVAIDGVRKRLYISDSVVKRVYVLGFDGTFLGERSTEAGFSRPGGLCTDSIGNLYVVDTLAARVEVFSPEGNYLRSIQSNAPPDYQFNLASNVAVDGEGRIFVVDSMNFRLEVFSPEGVSLRTIGQIGNVPGTFARPRGIAIDGGGNIFVADAMFGNVQIFDATGQLLLFFGTAGTAFGQFLLPSGAYVDKNQRIYIADVYNKRIQIFQLVAQ